jgi:dihydroxyacid dehydratase/phosphogluconate dehydratase
LPREIAPEQRRQQLAHRQIARCRLAQHRHRVGLQRHAVGASAAGALSGADQAAAREAGAVAQFAGGVPAMCDGVTQGQPGMELSLFSRDVIAMATAVALTHDMFDAALCWASATRSCPAC